MHPFHHFRALSWGFSVRPGERCEAPRRGVAGGRGTCSPDRRQGLDEHRRRRSFAAAGFGVPARSAICKASQKKSCIFPHASLMPPRPHQFGTLRSFVRGPKAKKGDMSRTGNGEQEWGKCENVETANSNVANYQCCCSNLVLAASAAESEPSGLQRLAWGSSPDGRCQSGVLRSWDRPRRTKASRA